MKKLVAFFAASAVLFSCEITEMTSNVSRSDRRTTNAYLRLTKKVPQGYDVYSLDESFSEKIQVTPANLSIASFVPDLSGYVYVAETSSDGTSLQLSLLATTGGHSPEIAASQAVDLENGSWSFDYELQWTSADGSSFLLETEGVLKHIYRCGMKLSSQEVAVDVRTFAYSYGLLYVVRRQEPNIIEYLNLEEEDASWQKAVPLPSLIDVLLPADRSGFVLAMKNSSSWEGAKELIFYANVTEGSFRSLWPPGNELVLAVIPLKSTRMAVVESWEKGRERLDGTGITRFFLWDYITNNISTISDNSLMGKVHDLPSNIHVLKPPC